MPQDREHGGELLRRAISAHRQGDIAGAERLYTKTLRLLPGDHNALHLLGLIRARQRRLAEAEQLIAKAVAVHASAEALGNHRAVLIELGRFEEAVQQLNRCLQLRPAHAQAHFNLGNALRKAGRPQPAADAFSAALRLKPDYIDALQNLAEALHELGQHEEAIAALRRAIAIAPANAKLLNNLGIALRNIGDLDEARDAFDRAIAADGTFVDAIYNRVRAGKTKGDGQLVSLLETLKANEPRLPPNERAKLYFALARLREAAGQYDESFADLLTANKAVRSIVTYDEPAALDMFHRLERVFTGRLIGERTGSGDPSTLPIFIVGFPRSGTTLTEHILASHPLVHGGGEINLVPEMIAVDLPGLQPDARFPEAVVDLAAGTLHQLGSLYVERLRRLDPKAERITDKNLGNALLLGLIHLILPQARIIHVQRNPIDACVSCFGLRFGGDTSSFIYDLGELGRRYRHQWHLMNHWRRALPSGALLDIQYETLVDDLDNQARRIIDFCGLAWDERCLAFHETERVVRTSSVSQVREPIYRSSLERWRRYEKHLDPLFAALGPELAAPFRS